MMGFASLNPSYELRSTHPVDLLLHDHRRADLHAVVKIDNVVVRESEAARRHCLPDGLGLVRAMELLERAAEMERARSDGFVRAARDVARQVGRALEHLRGWGPVRPFALGADALDAAPGEAVAPDTDAVGERLAVAEHEIKPPFPGPDHD